MDQDFHYYGTYYAARVGAGLVSKEATLVAKAANFIDFLNETTYAGYWKLVRETAPVASGNYTVVGELNNPRYTFQGGYFGTGVSPEDGLWCSYHFTPGNYPDPSGTPSILQVHGTEVAAALPQPRKISMNTLHEIRKVGNGIDADKAKLLNRPLSGLSRALQLDTQRTVSDPVRLERILKRAVGAGDLLPDNEMLKKKLLHRFKLILLGVRAHVIADTWAHQDFSGISHTMNTYWDVNGSWFGRQSIDYMDVGTTWKNVVLSSTKHENLKAVPNGTSYLGHGWAGHFPDYSFVKFRYRPCWQDSSAPAIVRDNPQQYRYAFIELCNMMARSLGKSFGVRTNQHYLDAAQKAISSPCEIANSSNCPRQHSSKEWQKYMTRVGLAPPDDIIDAKAEPDPKAVMPGMVVQSHNVTRYGTFVVNATSDLYLFQIAADYHFHFVKHWLKQHGIMTFSGSWSQQTSALASTITDLFQSGGSTTAPIRLSA